MNKVIFFTVVEVARGLRVNKLVVYRMIKNNDLKAVRVGHQFRVPRTELERLLGQPLTEEQVQMLSQ